MLNCRNYLLTLVKILLILNQNNRTAASFLLKIIRTVCTNKIIPKQNERVNSFIRNMIVGPTVIMNPDYINLKQTSDYPAFLRIDYSYIMYSSNDPYECLFLDLKNPERCSQNLALRRIPLARLYRPVASGRQGGTYDERL